MIINFYNHYRNVYKTKKVVVDKWKEVLVDGRKRARWDGSGKENVWKNKKEREKIKHKLYIRYSRKKIYASKTIKYVCSCLTFLLDIFRMVMDIFFMNTQQS